MTRGAPYVIQCVFFFPFFFFLFGVCTKVRTQDDPLAQWVKYNRAECLQWLLFLEGRGDHRSYSVCWSCSVGKAEYRCRECMSGDEMICKGCLLTQHQRLPLHRVEYWTGLSFKKKSLKDLDLRIQLGHWHGRPSERVCVLPEPSAGDDFVIVDDHGVHVVNLDYCGCGTGGSKPSQLLRARLYPATIINPRSAATFNVLDRFQLLSFESKISSFEFYHSLARESDNSGLKPPPDRYHEFRRMTREWNHLQMLKRAGRGHDPAGILATAPGECAVLCPACPHPKKNLPDGWEKEAEEKQFLYALFLAMDANFRLKRKDVSTEEKDPGLGDGWSFYCELQEYMAHVALHWDTVQERSTCVAHDAVDKPDREARGTASSGIGAVDCARHNMKRPLAVGDLQFGERYINIDYMFFRSVVGTELIRFYVSYDIACQWHTNIWVRMAKYSDGIKMVNKEAFLVFLVPKFHLPAHIEACNLNYSFNLTPNVGQTDGEAPERGWAAANPLASSTKEMGPGARRDTLNEHFNDLNWKKTVALGRTMYRKVTQAVPEMVATKRALDDMERSLRAAGGREVDSVAVWTEVALTWEKDPKKPNPFEMLEKDDHLARVRKDLAEEAAARVAAGTEDDDDVVEEMHVTEMVSMGLQLEENQRTLGFDMAAIGLHATNTQQKTMVERTSKLRRKIDAWVVHQEAFIPRLKGVRRREDAARARAASGQPVPGVRVQDIRLWLPSAILRLAGAKSRELCPTEIQRHEFRLRVGQAHEALHDIRRHLLVRTHTYKHKDKNKRGVRENMRSSHKIDAINDKVRRAAAKYRVARLALVSLGKALGEEGWEVTLKELRKEDVRPRPQSNIGDPTRQKATKALYGPQRKAKKRKVQPISWIWVSQAKGEAGERQEMNEGMILAALRIEWAKARARSMRWREEVDLLEEEMRRVLAFLAWRAEWWTSRVGLRGLSDGPQREGESAYATRQAALHMELRDGFAAKWQELPALIQKGREGKDVEDWEWEDEVSENEDDEDAEVPEEITRPVKSTYMDT
ncbi:hypothetical protein DFH06DRAFT_1012669 [Mycena polygramma]|nr:hypothetical protein DFH06DRAFT_1012669 [Mycena polygramma]